MREESERQRDDGGQSKAEHQKIVEQVLQKCLDHGLAVNFEKSEFHEKEVKFLGHVINGVDIKTQMDNLMPLKIDQRLTRKSKSRLSLDLPIIIVVSSKITQPK